jgi:2-methylcitrate dehydratase
MSAVHRSLRAVARFPIARTTGSFSVRVAAFRCSAAASAAIPRVGRTGLRSFASTTRRESGAPVEMAQRDYDPEIRDIAEYVHKKKIDSELAVCFVFACQ